MEQEFVFSEESLKLLADNLNIPELLNQLAQTQQHVSELAAYVYTLDRRVQQLLGEPVVTQTVKPGYGKNGINLDVETNYTKVPSTITTPR